MRRMWLLWRDETGSIAGEYGLIAGVILAVLAALVYAFSDRIAAVWERAINALR